MNFSSKQAQKVLRRWRENSVLFVEEGIRARPTEQQKAGLRDFDKEKRISIAAGQGTGKDAYVSWCILQFLVTRYYPKILATAPTAHQLRDILWAEIHKWLRGSVFRDEFIWNTGRVFHKNAREEWFATYSTANPSGSEESQAETLAGAHADSLLIVVDEASGVPDPVYRPIEGTITAPDNKILVVGNMTRRSGYFYDLHYDEISKRGWITHRWNGEECELVTEEQIQYFKDKYGEDSTPYRVRIQGLPPLEHDEKASIVPLEMSIPAIGREIFVEESDPLFLSVDVARYGEDSSIIMPRKGAQIYEWETIKKVNTQELASRIRLSYKEKRAAGVGIDANGIGAGVFDYLARKMGHDVVQGVMVSRQASEPNRFRNLRAEIYWKLRERFENGLISLPDTKEARELCDQLSVIRYRELNGKIKVEDKEDIRKEAAKRNLKFTSPDESDTLAISEFFYLDSDYIWKHSPPNPDDEDGLPPVNPEYAWMCV